MARVLIVTFMTMVRTMASDWDSRNRSMMMSVTGMIMS
jgi:hypothetical protein